MPTETGTSGPAEGHTKELLDSLLSEQNCDLLIDIILEKVKLPFWVPKAAVRSVLYKVVPGVLAEAVGALEAKLAGGTAA